MKYKISKYDIIIIAILALIVIAVVGISIYIITHPKRDINELTKVTDYSTYFMVVNTINSFYEQVGTENKDVIYNLLDRNYINKNNVTKTNIDSYVFNYGTDISIIADELTSYNIDENVAYYVHGKLEQNKYLESTKIVNDDFSMLMLVDINNLTYSLYPTTKEEYKNVLSTIPSIDVPKNVNNQYQGIIKITDEEMCVIYLTDFLNKLGENIDNTYDELISADTKEKLNTVEEYRNYVNTQLNDRTTVVDKCAIIDNDADKKIIVYDKNNNYYEFLEVGIMKYYVNLEIIKEEE